MMIQINYNKESGEVTGYSEDVANLNTGSVIESIIIEISEEDFEKLKQHKYDKTFDGVIIFKEKEDLKKISRQEELVDKLKNGSISESEKNELLLNFLGYGN